MFDFKSINLVHNKKAKEYIKGKPQFMIILSHSCQASCNYCFGPNKGPIMNLDVLKHVLNNIKKICEEKNILYPTIIFHGGEPLLAGHKLFQKVLEGINKIFSKKNVDLSLQSNLWLLDDKFCRLFLDHKIKLGTSLDGPEKITNIQRGKNYYKRCINGIYLARSYGLPIGCITTITPQNIDKIEEIIDFFCMERINLSIHASVRSINNNTSFFLNDNQYNYMLKKALKVYLKRRKEISISTFDNICQGIISQEGKICTFKDCLGMFVIYDPLGNIYSCQRLSNNEKFSLGKVKNNPSLSNLLDSPVAKYFYYRERMVNKICKNCLHYLYCKGGCLYNSIAINKIGKDPYCKTYNNFFNLIIKNILREMKNEKNIKAIKNIFSNQVKNPLLQKGPIIEICSWNNHPSIIARTAKRIIASVILARYSNISETINKCLEIGICRSFKSAEKSIKDLKYIINSNSNNLNNIYVHVTFNCQLKCSHCYANSINYKNKGIFFDVDKLYQIIKDSKEANFNKIVITGGEPLLHPKILEILCHLTYLRRIIKPTKLCLRTNFSLDIDNNLFSKIALAFDQIIVSIDGDKASHENRRGKGSYNKAVNNCIHYNNMFQGKINSAGLFISGSLNNKEVKGDVGKNLIKLGLSIGLNEECIRFRPVLPIGRAYDCNKRVIPESINNHINSFELLHNGFLPINTCGIGQNLYIEPNGDCFPCYAFNTKHAYIGNILKQNLKSILCSSKFKKLKNHTVDTNQKCKKCNLRYLCGGLCRAWSKNKMKFNLDESPNNCDSLRKKAYNLFNAAKDYLEIKNLSFKKSFSKDKINCNASKNEIFLTSSDK